MSARKAIARLTRNQQTQKPISGRVPPVEATVHPLPSPRARREIRRAKLRELAEDPTTDLTPMAGIVVGVAASAVIWLVVGLAVWLL
jgi:hypothetical protein